MRPISSVLTLVVAAGVIAAPIAAPPSQQPQAPPVFRAGVDLVQVDVTVLDKQRRPVRGLKASDFTIVEDGKPQTVAAFSEVDVPDPPEAPVVNGTPVTWMRDVAPDVQSNDLAAGRLLILLIDDALIPNDPRIVAHARLITQAAVDRLGPGDRMSVVFTEGSRQAQDFTSDRARLKAAVAMMHPGRALYSFGWESIPSVSIQAYTDPTHNPHPGPDPDGPVRDGSFATLQMVSEALLSSPERRKALIYVSPGVPVNAMFAGNGNMAGGAAGVRPMVNREAMVRLTEQMPELFRRMQRANITVYAIDPIGPIGLEYYIRDRISAIPQMHGYSTGALFDPRTQEAEVRPCNNTFGANAVPIPACFVPEAGDLAHVTAGFAREFLETAAGNTGGRAVVGNESFIPAIEQLFVENGSYYLIGYRAPPGNKPGDLHRLKVTVNRPGVEVRTRSGYYTPAPEKIDPKKKEISPTSKAIAGVLANADLPLQAALAPFVDPVKHVPVVLVVLGLQATALDKPMSDTVEVQTRAFTPEGDARGIQVQQAYIAVRPSASADVVRYEALSSIALKPGRYRLRIGAYSGLLDTAGSVFADVEVPDFAKEAVSLSGVMVTATPAAPASPIEVFAKIVPVVPTASRTFQKLDRVSAFVRVYASGASRAADASDVSATVRARITNDRGESVLDKRDDLGPSRFTGTPRAADFRLDLPIVSLQRGQYLLTIEAERGAARASRTVRFVVR